MSFYYQDMDVYYIALGFVDNVMEITKKYGPVLSNMMSNLEKLTTRIPLELAHATGVHGRVLPDEEYRRIRGIVYECQAQIEILWRRKQIREKDADELGDTLMVLAKLLTDLMAQSQETEAGLPKAPSGKPHVKPPPLKPKPKKLQIYPPKKPIFD